MDGRHVLVGARRDDDEGADAGAAYLFDVPFACHADLDGDGELTTIDFLLFLNV